MRTIQIITVIIIVLIGCSEGRNKNHANITEGHADSLQLKQAFLQLPQLISVYNSVIKDSESILKIIRRNNSNWTFRGKDDIEIVFSAETPYKGVLSWHFKESGLIYFFFNQSYFEYFKNQLASANFIEIIDNETNPSVKARFYKHNGILVKLLNVVTKDSTSSFVVVIQNELK